MATLIMPAPRPGLSRRTMLATALAGGFLAGCGQSTGGGANTSGVIDTSGGKI
jgi:hypothetical protein